MAKTKVRIGIIGGSGLYHMKGISETEELRVDTPFGPPSDALMLGTVAGVRCAFLPRHGRGHTILPSEINGRANIWALKSLGVETVVAFGAVGSLREELAPGHFVVPDQIVDKTTLRRSTFFGHGVVGHVAFADPFCGGVAKVLSAAAKALDIPVHPKGTLACMEGPAFSTRAESEVNRKLGCDLIGMTVVPEAKLAREAELCYALVAMVTDYDCWKAGEEVGVEKVMAVMKANSENAQRLLSRALPELAKLPSGACACSRALEHAIMTDPAAMPKETAEQLALIIGKRIRR
ncbi:MAG: S-methyl-5'-thioadenosine phosphorylase [Elusimicrobiota bacterium]